MAAKEAGRKTNSDLTFLLTARRSKCRALGAVAKRPVALAGNLRLIPLSGLAHRRRFHPGCLTHWRTSIHSLASATPARAPDRTLKWLRALIVFGSRFRSGLAAFAHFENRAANYIRAAHPFAKQRRIELVTALAVRTENRKVHRLAFYPTGAFAERRRSEADSHPSRTVRKRPVCASSAHNNQARDARRGCPRLAAGRFLTGAARKLTRPPIVCSTASPGPRNRVRGLSRAPCRRE